jgi:hypothetical protein
MTAEAVTRALVVGWDPASPVAVSVALAAVAAVATAAAIPPSLSLFRQANLIGHDLSKVGRPPMCVGSTPSPYAAAHCSYVYTHSALLSLLMPPCPRRMALS